MAPGHIVHISLSPGGVPKLPVRSARVTKQGLDGDLHRDMAHHGGPERALCVFAMEQIRLLQAEGHNVSPGAIGENLTVEGINSPCFNIRKSFADGDISRVSQKSRPGSSRVYARVLRDGMIRQGDRVRLVHPDG